MSDPHFIDNLDGNTLAAAITRVLNDGITKRDNAFDEPTTPPGRLDIASAFFSPAGFAEIAIALEGIEKVRLMIGAEPPSEALPPRRPLEETPWQFERRLLRERLAELEEGLRRDRDRFPFSHAGRAALKSLIAVLRSGKMETRRYERAFMHAKAYIFAPRTGVSGSGGIIAGSSNLTRAGVMHNLELNLGRFDDPIVGQAQAWYERLWDEAVPIDLTEILEEVFAEWSPFEIFLRTLYQLYGSEVAEEEKADRGLPLTNFQKHGAARAMRLIRENGGAIVADEVGLGKTFIAGEILKLFVDNRHRCLLICPAQLRDTTWRKFRSTHFLNDVECLSYEELAIDRQIAMADPSQYQDKLLRGLNEYQLVVVDEAHNYRNPDTATRAAVLRKLLWGQRRDVLLLTATPVNNSLWDIYHLIRYYMRQDAFLADRGILSIKDRFEQASRQDPSNLSPDLLYPIIDATTVKRTRQFVKKHYSGDHIRLADGTEATIVFPEPRAITVRYPLSEPLSEVFDLIDEALDPDVGNGAITFARYVPDAFRLDADDGDLFGDEDARTAATVGLLRSGLLKRFESSAFAFETTLQKMIGEHRTFLDALDKGHVIRTELIHEISVVDDEDMDAVLAAHGDAMPAGLYNIAALRNATEADLHRLERLRSAVALVTSQQDPKLAALVLTLLAIATEAEREAVSEDDARQKRKVLVFSSYADTVAYLRRQLAAEIDQNPELAPYRGRIVAVSGSVDVEPEAIGRQGAVSGFAPVSTESTGAEDRFDILLSTDILAEGVNLQQCRHIINYDVPWNPMRLVQRHGRVDRIGSTHARVFLRTIFPADRLNQLLNLEQRILQKIAMAAASVGVASPVQGGAAGNQVFTETRAQIERLLAEDPSLFERGAGSAGQTGEEYRQTLRKALESNSTLLQRMPHGAGSGMVRGDRQGVFFCAMVGVRTYLRFVPAADDWLPTGEPVVSEVGTCLRLIECEVTTARNVAPALESAVFDLWEVARSSIHESWMRETDPANIQPKVRPLNQRVAEFIRGHRPQHEDGGEINNALDILESPWPRREEIMLRNWFSDPDRDGAEKAHYLVTKIRETGLAPFTQPKLLPPIELNDIELVCWLGVASA
ncbi:helicase [Rhizobium bangladeshense]|uniref:helicase-related protein n=1 Tax=Rhizobium bangladeshense TaxID=1138189 RepID=UPI001C835FF9|nr:helicase-related protein [Rhizobium bangladeshense]MBX4918372.1 helicase [Rhizobium bangladeshense]